jgi:hypothetical protein
MAPAALFTHRMDLTENLFLKMLTSMLNVSHHAAEPRNTPPTTRPAEP